MGSGLIDYYEAFCLIHNLSPFLPGTVRSFCRNAETFRSALEWGVYSEDLVDYYLCESICNYL